MNAVLVEHRHHIIPAGILLLCLVLVFYLSATGKNREDERILLETRITAEQVRLRIKACVDSRSKLIDALAALPRENRQQAMDTWADSARILLPIHSGVLALNFIDADRIIRVVYPYESNKAALNADLSQHPNPSVGEAMRTAEEADQLARTDIVQLLQAGAGFAVYRQILSTQGQLLGFVNGVFRVQNLLDSCLSEQPLRDRFNFNILENGELFHAEPPSDEPLQSAYQVTLPIDIMGRTWELSFAPSAAYLATLNSLLRKIGIALGIVVSFLMSIGSHIMLKQQKALSDRETQYRLLVENQTDLVVKLNSEGELLYVSPSYCKLFGESESELLNQQFMPLVHSEDQELTRQSFDSLKKPPHTSYHKQRAMTQDGWRWLAWSNTALLDEGGQLQAIIAVGRDITDVKELEENIAHTQKMNALGEMAGSITHDFNNVLQVIMGNIESMLANKTQDQKMRISLAQMYKAVLRAMSLTEKLSTLSRQENTQTETFDIYELMDTSVAMLKRTLPASIRISLISSPITLPVDADRAQIEQVLLNICFNARDALDGNGDIRLSAARQIIDDPTLLKMKEIAEGEYAVITIEDNGCGIDSNVLPRIFEPFFTTKPKSSGAGLGLANCYSIVKQHNGMITVDSTSGVGSRFSVCLPIATPSAIAPQAEEVEKEELAIQSTATDSRKLVLVADDNPDILDLTCAHLKAAGFETVSARSGTEVLTVYEQNIQDIALVILDFVLPEISGQDLVEQIRAYDDEVKVLFVTGFIPNDVIVRLKDPVIRKPYRRVEFLETVERLLGGTS